MPIVCIGLSHHTAPVSVRESHAFPTARLSEALQLLCTYDAVDEAVILQTCGRLEIYAEVEDFERGAEQIKGFLVQFRHGAVEFDLESYLYTHLGRESVEHLLRVATGLDSMLIGEAEILGQVKSAYLHAQRAGACGSSLHKLFSEALNAGKAARSQTEIGEESASVATAAVDSIEAQLGSLAELCVAVIGAGAMGRSAARRFRAKGVGSLSIVNRTHARAEEIVGELGSGVAHALDELPAILEAADVIVSSTEASDFILTPDNVAPAMAKRANRPLLVLDIAVPRDTDPDVAEIAGVTLLDID
ncbi:MAG TPA: glutamyl-tRNA reductase, partial [Candidatus Dormibacteraeota bacterium]|nr:glutamyl-tRNA reductase [Candidatus Dormibacteraeota bacterium]